MTDKESAEIERMMIKHVCGMFEDSSERDPASIDLMIGNQLNKKTNKLNPREQWELQIVLLFGSEVQDFDVIVPWRTACRYLLEDSLEDEDEEDWQYIIDLVETAFKETLEGLKKRLEDLRAAKIQ